MMSFNGSSSDVSTRLGDQEFGHSVFESERSCYGRVDVGGRVRSVVRRRGRRSIRQAGVLQVEYQSVLDQQVVRVE